MRDLVAANSAPAPQAPARNPPPSTPNRHPSTASLETYNSHRRVKRPSLGDRRVYRPARRATLSRIDETPALRPRSKSLQRSGDFSSTRAMLRSRSNVSADTGRSVPVCNQSQEVFNTVDYSSFHYDTKASDSSDDVPASMTDLPIVVPMDPLTGSYIPYPEYAYYDSSRTGRYEWRCRRKAKNNNLFLAFMY